MLWDRVTALLWSGQGAGWVSGIGAHHVQDAEEFFFKGENFLKWAILWMQMELMRAGLYLGHNFLCVD